MQFTEIPAAAEAATKPHFLGELTDAMARRIRSSDYVVFDFETTNKTRFCPPISLSKDVKIGGESLSKYRRRFGDVKVTLDVRVRPRIISIQLSDGSKHAFDLDQLSKADQARLVEACLDQQITIGWNLGFDFAWAMGISKNWRPSLTLDVMLLGRCLRPGMFWKIHELAARDVDAHPELLEAAGAAPTHFEDEEDSHFVDDGEFSSAALKIVSRTEASASLDAVSVALGLGRLDKSFQKPANWCVTPLSEGHYDYVMGDVDAPLVILKRMFPGAETMDHIVNEVSNEDEGKGREFQDIFEPAPYELALIHDRGMPVHLPTLEAIRAHRKGLVPSLIEQLIAPENMPGMAPFQAKLSSAAVSTSREMKNVLAEYAKANGCELDIGGDGSPVIQAKAAKLKGAFDLAGWKLWDKLQHARKTMASCTEYEALSEVDPEHAGWARVHPLISANAATMRTTSRTPNSQNMERVPDRPADFMAENTDHAARLLAWHLLQFRGVIQSRPGHKILLADYGQIELRLAAALSIRCKNEIVAALNGDFPLAPAWIVDALRSETRPEVTGDFALPAAFWDLWTRVKAQGFSMAKLFREGVDPHLYTGLQMAVKQGVVTLPDGVAAMAFLKGLTKDEEKALKSKIKNQRTGAKALNFGLLYGMGAESLWVQGVVAYGLSWTREEAVAARDEWLNELFPEVQLWQLWHKMVHRASKYKTTRMIRRSKFSGKLEMREERMRRGTTLGGRPFCDPDTRILNYQDQGTGASLAVFAIVSMEQPARDHIISFVHDEIVLEVPEHMLELCAAQLERSMVKAGDRFLAAYRIPVEAAPEWGDLWVKD